MNTYTEHVTRVLAEDIRHEQLGTVAVLRFAPPEGQEKRPATLGPQSIQAVTGAIAEALDRAAAGEIQAIALTGTGKVFLAGADLSMFADATAVAHVDEMTRAAHDLQIRVRESDVPILAHLNGATLGGGLEVALLATTRTAAEDVRGIGLPETSLGILPGWGGTTLVASVIGAENAARLVLDDPQRDRTLSAAQAHKIGLVDALAADLPAALDLFAGIVAERRRSAGEQPAFTRPEVLPTLDSPAAEELKAALEVAGPTGESRRDRAARMEAQGAPAAARVIALWDQLPGSSLRDALDREAVALGDLVRSFGASASLYSAEMLRRGKPGRTPVDGAREIRRVGVAGAGLMASQIAAQLALGLRVPVVLRDLDEEIAAKGLANAREVVARTAQRGAIDEATAAEVSELLSATETVSDLADCDLVLEAVPEILKIKKSVFAELEGVLAPDALLVSNTSSLSVAAMAEDLQHPERVVGLHFFNPVEKMPLVEVIHTPATNEVTLATGMEVVRRLRKFAVRSADAPGFIVNRLLFRVLGAVLASLDAGADPAAVDASLDPLGMPMRPFTLLDLVGLAVADHVGEVLREELGDRFHASPGLHAMAEAKGRFTEKTAGVVHQPVSAQVGEVCGQGADEAARSAAPVGDELLAVVQDSLAEEIALMLDEGVVEHPEQVDLAMILGAGFPRHRGGITPYLDAVGASQRTVGRTFHGERFTGQEA